MSTVFQIEVSRDDGTTWRPALHPDIVFTHRCDIPTDDQGRRWRLTAEGSVMLAILSSPFVIYTRSTRR